MVGHLIRSPGCGQEILSDSVGHSHGDEELITFSGLLRKELGGEDKIFRLGKG